MRTFIMKVNHPLENFELNNLTKNRIDMVTRVINSVFWIDHNIRKEVQLFLCFKNNKTLHYKPIFKNMNPDERNIASFIKYILEGRKFPGITLKEKSFEEIISQFNIQDIYFLDSKGKKLTEKKLKPNPVFILGDNKGYEDYKIPEQAIKINIGSKSYLTSHCIAYLNIYMDDNL